MRARLDVARAWQAANERPYFYAGAGKGAVPAAWKQAAWAEAVAATTGLHYATVLLDLVKAFERIPHWFLVQQAATYGFNIVLLRLSVAAYKLQRAVGVEGVYSALLVAQRGITAGSVFATIEMRIVMIEALDRVVACCPCVRLTCYVDDVSLEMVGTTDRIGQRLPQATLVFTGHLEGASLEFFSNQECRLRLGPGA